MPTAIEIENAVRASSTKREAAVRLGTTGSSVGARILVHLPHLLPAWRSLPSDGAFTRQGVSLPPPAKTQAAADALVAEALADAPLRTGDPQRQNVARLLLAMYAITGSLTFPRGWVRAVVLAFRAAGLKAPTTAAVRWYRSRVAAVPDSFADIPGVDRQLIDDLIAL